MLSLNKKSKCRYVQYFCILLLMLAYSAYTDSDQVDITQIDQFPHEYEGEVFSGYLNISDFDKQFYYMLFKSQAENNQTDPLVLWLNGGPGCSSMIGMTSENGPFIFPPQSNKMVINQHAWNKNAHVMYLQSPAGVGFSKGKKQSLTSNDSSVALDNYKALLKFFQKYPQLTDKDFWIAGQSYAGIYIPMLAQQIIIHNQQQQSQDHKINLKGILVGNGCTHPYQCYTSKYLSRYQIQFMYTRGFIDTADYSQYVANCITSKNQASLSCNNTQKKIQDNFYSSKANIYNVYGVCYPVPTNSAFFDSYLQKMIKKEQSGQHILKHSLRCSDTVGPNSLFNRNQNRKPLNVQSNQTLKWTPCSDTITYTIESRAVYTTIPVLVKYGLKIHYYAGDLDAMVPIQGTLDWLKRYRSDFGASIKRGWRPWLVDGKDFGGMLWELDGLTFWSVVGAGHMVPTDKPKEAKFMFDVILGKKSLTLGGQNQSIIKQI